MYKFTIIAQLIPKYHQSPGAKAARLAEGPEEEEVCHDEGLIRPHFSLLVGKWIKLSTPRAPRMVKTALRYFAKYSKSKKIRKMPRGHLETQEREARDET